MHRDQYGNLRVRGPGDVAPVQLCWSDDTAVAFDKPTGLLAHNSAFAGPREWTLVQVAQRILGHKVGLMHRLDRGTSGLVLMARTTEHAAQWQAALEAGQKRYLAVVRGKLESTLDIDHPVREPAGARSEAQTTMRPLQQSPTERCTLVELTLHTGRWRQARQHASHANHPIVGDMDLGDRKFNRDLMARTGLERMVLHAWRLELVHPLTGEAMLLEAPLPADLLPFLAAVGLDAPPLLAPAGGE